MKNILLLTHGRFAEGIADSMRMILGETGNFSFLCVLDKDSTQTVMELLSGKLKEFGNDYPTVIITDIISGSTTQAAVRLMSENEGVHVIAGLNLGLLLEVGLLELTGDRENDKELLRKAVTGSKEGIALAEDFLNGEDSEEL